MVKVPRYKEQINGQTWPKSSGTFVSRHKETFISQVRHRPRDTLAVIHHFILASLSLSSLMLWVRHNWCYPVKRTPGIVIIIILSSSLLYSFSSLYATHALIYSSHSLQFTLYGKGKWNGKGIFFLFLLLLLQGIEIQVTLKKIMDKSQNCTLDSLDLTPTAE